MGASWCSASIRRDRARPPRGVDRDIGEGRLGHLDGHDVARVALRYDETKADLIHDDEYEAVVFPLAEQLDVTALVPVDYDDRDLQVDAPADVSYALPAAPIDTKAYWTAAERDIRDHLVRTLALDIATNPALKLYGRPGETTDSFANRCREVGIEQGGREIATLRALGFNATSVVVSVLAESLALATLGGAIGGLGAYLAFNGYQTSTMNFQTFSQVAFAFQVTPQLLVLGLVYALGMGLIGGLLPAVRAARLPIPSALREL